MSHEPAPQPPSDLAAPAAGAHSRARAHFERASQSLPPLFPSQPVEPISPLSLFSPRTGFPGPLLPQDRSRLPPVTPLSPMFQNDPILDAKGLTPTPSPMDRRDFHDSYSARAMPPSPSLFDSRPLASDHINASRDPAPLPPFFPPAHRVHASQPLEFPESPMFRPLENIPLTLPRHLHAQITRSQAQSSLFHIPAPTSPPPPSVMSASAERDTIFSSALPHRQNSEHTNQSDRMDVDTILTTPFPNSQIIPHLIIDRPLVRAAELLQQKVFRSPGFLSLVQNLKESFRLRREDSVGGTVRRRNDLVKVVVNVEDFGYPSSDREDVHICLDTTPGISRENVEYLKTVVLNQLETVKRGAREALYQFSVILVDQLRYRVMRKDDILALQCSVVDRFVVARNCILEKYIQYARSRKWIENMSTNQRRGCLSHQQNNILRMWLYRNFTDPYPDEDAKDMMMQETKLSMEQVNNWLINARSRFWKPCMDYFDRVSLERKMAALIRQRMIMSTEQKIKAAQSKSALPESRGRSRRQVE